MQTVKHTDLLTQNMPVQQNRKVVTRAMITKIQPQRNMLRGALCVAKGSITSCVDNASAKLSQNITATQNGTVSILSLWTTSSKWLMFQKKKPKTKQRKHNQKQTNKNHLLWVRNPFKDTARKNGKQTKHKDNIEVFQQLTTPSEQYQENTLFNL